MPHRLQRFMGGWALLLAGLLFLASLSWSGALYAQSNGAENGSLGAYLQMVESLEKQPIEKQIEILRGFLEEHPDSPYRAEIEKNVQQLDNFLTATNPERRREARDAEIYLRAVEFAKNLSPSDRMAMWEQYLEENPTSVYRKEAEANLDELRRQSGGGVQPLPPPTGRQEIQTQPVARDLPYKNAKKATLLATFAGLVVPGMGHWYTKDYTLAGVLTGLRLGGMGLGIPGIINNNTGMIIAGAVLSGFSYFTDIIDAPFSVRRYNDKLEQQAVRPLPPEEMEMVASTYEFSISFSF